MTIVSQVSYSHAVNRRTASLHDSSVDPGLIGILASLAYLQRRAVRLVGDIEELDARSTAYRACAAAT
ncbi:hypothetical protein K1X09_25380 [Paenibacillus lautus]|nr:hypothetical protein [Paenibacillus lautus]